MVDFCKHFFATTDKILSLIFNCTAKSWFKSGVLPKPKKSTWNVADTLFQTLYFENMLHLTSYIKW